MDHCPITFEQDNLDNEDLGSLLNELIGLGIMTQDGISYRMRSRLIAQMFGNEGEVTDALDRLEKNEPYGDKA